MGKYIISLEHQKEESKPIVETNIYFVRGCEGNSFHIGDIRVAGPKAWGGGHIIEARKTTAKDILYALNCLYNPSHQPQKTILKEVHVLLMSIRRRKPANH